MEQFSQMDDTSGAIRLRWEHSPSDVYTYNVYRLNADDSRTFLWATPGNACFVPLVTRPPGEEQTEILIEAVSPEFGFSEAVSTTIDWETTGIGGGNSGSLFLQHPAINPVRGILSIGYNLPGPGRTTLRVYDLSGRVVENLVDAELQAGEYRVNWNTDTVPSGLYVYKLDCPAGSLTRKCMVL